MLDFLLGKFKKNKIHNIVKDDCFSNPNEAAALYWDLPTNCHHCGVIKGPLHSCRRGYLYFCSNASIKTLKCRTQTGKTKIR